MNGERSFANRTTGRTRYDHTGGNVPWHDAARRDDGAAADSHALQNNGLGSDPSLLLNDDRLDDQIERRTQMVMASSAQEGTL